MDQLFNDFCNKMIIKNYSRSTQKSYQYELKKYLKFCENEKKIINSASFQDFLVGLIKIKKLSETSLKQSIGAVKFFLSLLLTSLMN